MALDDLLYVGNGLAYSPSIGRLLFWGNIDPNEEDPENPGQGEPSIPPNPFPDIGETGPNGEQWRAIGFEVAETGPYFSFYCSPNPKFFPGSTSQSVNPSDVVSAFANILPSIGAGEIRRLKLQTWTTGASWDGTDYPLSLQVSGDYAPKYRIRTIHGATTYDALATSLGLTNTQLVARLETAPFKVVIDGLTVKVRHNGYTAGGGSVPSFDFAIAGTGNMRMGGTFKLGSNPDIRFAAVNAPSSVLTRYHSSISMPKTFGVPISTLNIYAAATIPKFNYSPPQYVWGYYEQHDDDGTMYYGIGLYTVELSISSSFSAYLYI